jgi:hypothetical protein
VGSGVAGKGKALLALPDDLVTDGGGNAIGPKATDSQVISVMDEPFNRLLHGHYFVYQGSLFTVKKFPGFVGIRVHKKWALTLSDNLKHAFSSFWY